MIEQFCYWIREREYVRRAKEAGEPRPWSEDPIFQNYHFCNVRREDDRGTKEIRALGKAVGLEDLPWFYTAARLLNHPPSIDTVMRHGWEGLKERREEGKKIFNTAYLVSTCGARMDKIDYVAGVVGEVAKRRVPRTSCRAAYDVIHDVNGMGSFLAGQVIADLKNDRYLDHVIDFHTFSVMGPGSKKGLDYIFGPGTTHTTYQDRLNKLKGGLPGDIRGLVLHDQDLQSCLGEFSKFMKYKQNLPGRRRKYVPNIHV